MDLNNCWYELYLKKKYAFFMCVQGVERNGEKGREMERMGGMGGKYGDFKGMKMGMKK